MKTGVVISTSAPVPQGEGRDGAAPSLDPTRCPECGEYGLWYQYDFDLPLKHFRCWPCWRMWEDTRG